MQIILHEQCECAYWIEIIFSVDFAFDIRLFIKPLRNYNSNPIQKNIKLWFVCIQQNIMITSSNFFKKTFFPSEDNIEEANNDKNKLIGPWQQIPKVSKLLKYDIIRKRNRSSINQYNPYIPRDRKDKLLQKKFQRQVPLIDPKVFQPLQCATLPKNSSPNTQKFNPQKSQASHLPNISIKRYADIFDYKQAPITQFQRALMKIPQYKLRNLKCADDLNFIRRNSIKKQNSIRSRAESRQQVVQQQKKNKKQNEASDDINSKFMAYQKHLKASKRNRYYQGIAIHPIKYEISDNFSSLQ